MNSRDMDELAGWLAAERDGSWEEADARFAAIASRHLPKTAEPRHLGSQVMAALPLGARAGWFRFALDAASWWWVRATVGASVGVLGIALAAVTVGQLLGFATASVELFARLVHGVSASLSAAFDLAVAAWLVLLDLGRAAMIVATSGPAPALIGANVLLACLAVAGLSRLLSSREECA